MSEYLLLRLIAAGSLIGLVTMLNLAGKVVQAAFHRLHVRKGTQV